MSKKKKDDCPLMPIDLVTALGHPMRQRILVLMEEAEDAQPLSPNMTCKLMGKPGSLSQISYHYKVLKEVGAIHQTKEIPRRGAMEHLYRPTPKMEKRLAALAKVAREEEAQDGK